ncbi:MAG: hypothetical protein ACYTXY_28870, partial [Nostoc sp.]
MTNNAIVSADNAIASTNNVIALGCKNYSHKIAKIHYKSNTWLRQMLKRLWQWLKRSFQRLFGNKQTPPMG